MAVLGWDIEIASPFEGERDWLAMEDPLGISCAAIADKEQTIAWTPFGHEILPVSDERTSRLNPLQARDMADYLYRRAESGDLIVTWNGLGFDFPVLARECEDDDYTKMLARLALDSCDIGFAMLAERGYMIGLETAAKAMNLPGKLEGVNGSIAPLLWNQPDRELTDREAMALYATGLQSGSIEARRICVEYVKRDAEATRDVYHALIKARSLVWRTKKGTLARYPWHPYVTHNEKYGSHIATAREALDLDPPNVSWMSNPRPRSAYIGWAQKTLSL